jgi:hypothetical protein
MSSRVVLLLACALAAPALASCDASPNSTGSADESNLATRVAPPPTTPTFPRPPLVPAPPLTPVVVITPPAVLSFIPTGAAARANLAARDELAALTQDAQSQALTDAQRTAGYYGFPYPCPAWCPPASPPTIGAGSPLWYPLVVRGVEAPECLRDPRAPTCVCYGPFTCVRPWGFYCVLTPSPPPGQASPSPPPGQTSPSPTPGQTSPSPSPPPGAECGVPPEDFSCAVKPGGEDPCGFCVFVDGVLTCCCDDACGDYDDCCDDAGGCCAVRRPSETRRDAGERASTARRERRRRRERSRPSADAGG